MNAAAKLPDPYWYAAAEQALRAANEANHVLVPAEFLDLHPKFAPLEFSWGLRNVARLAWCCSKDDVDRLAPWFHPSARLASRCVWSNEVFVVGGNFSFSYSADQQSRMHLTAWYERLDRYASGIPAREARIRAAAPSASGSIPRPRVLLVGASQMGNVGDDLIASVIAEMLADEGAEVFLSGPDVDPLHLANYDAVVVGGGGLIYASRDGSNESQNLANYLKFGPIAAHLGIPAALLAVGDQDHAAGIEKNDLALRFSREALSRFDRITTRDSDSTRLLQKLGGRAVKTGSDPVFRLFERARKCVRPTANQPRRIALVGELLSYPWLTQLLTDPASSLAAEVQDNEFDLLVMSDDDVEHCQRVQQQLRDVATAVGLIDLRGLDLDALVFLFASYRSVITTRFHGLILAALSGVPAVALDSPKGKKARLLRELNAADRLLDESSQSAETISLAIRGELPPLPTGALELAAARCSEHTQALRGLVRAPAKAVSDTPPSVATVRATPSSKSNSASVLNERDGSVSLCWAASSRETKGYANLGDSLSAVMVGALSGLPVKHVNFDEPRTKLVAVGSIGHAIKGGTAVIWGSGVSIRNGVLAQNVPQTQYDVRAIRGAISAQHLRDFGIAVPEIYGDPVWLLPSIFNEPVEQQYELGVIPHIQDIERPHPDSPARADSLRYVVDASEADKVVVINTWHEPTLAGLIKKLKLIRSCKRIVSQSFHGVVIAEAYGIPVLNFRQLPKAPTGVVRLDLTEPCSTDPRIYEFFAGGRRPYFHMYNQRRDERSDWEKIIRCVDETWEPFEYDASALIESFPLPLAYDPLRASAPNVSRLASINF